MVIPLEINFIRESNVGADLRVSPGEMDDHDKLENRDGMKEGEHMELGDGVIKGAHTGALLRNNGMDAPIRGIPQPNAPLAQIVQ